MSSSPASPRNTTGGSPKSSGGRTTHTETIAAGPLGPRSVAIHTRPSPTGQSARFVLSSTACKSRPVTASRTVFNWALVDTTHLGAKGDLHAPVQVTFTGAAFFDGYHQKTKQGVKRASQHGRCNSSVRAL